MMTSNTTPQFSPFSKDWAALERRLGVDLTGDTEASKAAKKLIRLRSDLLLRYPWFGSLALRLAPKARTMPQPMATDGTHLYYVPARLVAATDDDCRFLVAHEVLHCALGHPYRCGKRNLGRWNRACDYVTNALLVDAGFTLPAGMLLDRQFDGLSAEVVYARLAADEQEDQPGGPDGTRPDFDPAPPPDPQPPEPAQDDPQDAQPDEPQQEPQEQDEPEPEQAPLSAADWQIAAEQATMAANKAGKTPGGAAAATKAAQTTSTDWQTLLRRFLQRLSPSGYTWTRPSKKALAHGLYLPSVERKSAPKLALAFDDSASTEGFRRWFVAEAATLLREFQPAGITVVTCDVAIHHVATYTAEEITDLAERNDSPLFHLGSNGGTSFRPVLDFFSADACEARDEEPPAALLYLTDLQADFPPEPEYPVLWVTSAKVADDAPWGETIHVDPDV